MSRLKVQHGVVMDKPWLAQESNTKTACSDEASRSSQSLPARFLHHCPRERRSLPGERWCRQATAPFPGLLPPTPRRPDTLNCGLVREHKPQSEVSSPASRRRREATLWFSGGNSPPPTRRLSPWATPEREKGQPFSRSSAPEPALCVELKPQRSLKTTSSRNERCQHL